MDAKIKIEIPTWDSVKSNECAIPEQGEVVFAYYGHKNICIEKDDVIMWVDRDDLTRILKMLDETIGVEISKGRIVKKRP